ncbi:MAG TPA: arginase, partial [Candidatus Kapabacteria bacterium]|nr:arginase [Candidatus Kapabacteria bacterium]
VDMGPSAVRIAGVSEKLRALGYTVHDEGDLQIKNQETQKIKDQHLKYLPEIARAVTIMAHKTEKIMDEGGFPLAIGGDHSMAIGTIAGIASHCKRNNKRLGVIWVDAHSDVNTPETSPSGNIHGMPLAVTLGIGPTELTTVGGDFKKVDPKNLILIGLRSIDEGEKQLIKKLGIQSYTMADIDKQGAHKVISQALADLHKRVDHIHVSFDIDSVDPTVAPGVGTPVAGGLTYREAMLIMEEIADSGFLNSLDIVEINPILDNHNQTAEFAAELVASCMGKRIL